MRGGWHFLQGAPHELLPVRFNGVPGLFWDGGRPATGIYTRPAQTYTDMLWRYGAPVEGTAFVNGWQVRWHERDAATWLYPHEPRPDGYLFESPLVSWWNPLFGNTDGIRTSLRRYINSDLTVIDAVVHGHKPAGQAYLPASDPDRRAYVEHLMREVSKAPLAWRFEGNWLYLARKQKLRDLFHDLINDLLDDYQRHLPRETYQEQKSGIINTLDRRPSDFLGEDGQYELEQLPAAVQALVWGYPQQVTIGYLLNPGCRPESGGRAYICDRPLHQHEKVA